jgi:hypothetical protein
VRQAWLTPDRGRFNGVNRPSLASTNHQENQDTTMNSFLTHVAVMCAAALATLPTIQLGYRDCFRCEINETWEYGLAPLQLTLDPQENGTVRIRWTGDAPPYQLQSRASLSAGDWQHEGAPTDTLNATPPTDGTARFFRVLSLFGNPE